MLTQLKQGRMYWTMQLSLIHSSHSFSSDLFYVLMMFWCFDDDDMMI